MSGLLRRAHQGQFGEDVVRVLATAAGPTVASCDLDSRETAPAGRASVRVKVPTADVLTVRMLRDLRIAGIESHLSARLAADSRDLVRCRGRDSPTDLAVPPDGLEIL